MAIFSSSLQQLMAKKDIFLPVLVMCIVMAMVLPMPTWLLDISLTISITLSILILMTVMFIEKPLELSSFPTILLLTTSLRLALNIATTRLILSNGHTGTSAAGHVIEAFSGFVDAEMEKRIAQKNISSMKIRERISQAVLTRLEILKPNKEAARRAAALLSLPPHLPLASRLMYRSVDGMWRAAGDTSTDFNFYTKRGILAGVYSSTLLRWFTDQSDNEQQTREFLAARIDNVMQFEKFKAKVKEQTKDFPSLADILGKLGGARKG